MFLFGIIEILYFATVLSAINIPLTTEKPHSLQPDTDVTSKTDVHDVSGLFESSAKSVNAIKQIFEQRTIALEGGSSVIANLSTVSESNNPKGLDEKTSFDNGTAIKSNRSNTFHTAVQTEGGLLQIPLNVEDESDHPSVVPRKGAWPKIVPRKGAEPYEPFAEVEDNTEMKPPACNCCETHSSDQNSGNSTADPRCVSCCNTSNTKNSDISIALKNDRTDLKSAYNNSNDDDFKTGDNTINGTDIKNEMTLLNVSNSTFDYLYRANPPLKKKSKPLVTSDTDTDQKQPKIPPSSSTEKSDFVIPVILLILAVPIVVVLAMLFYRKGTEFWERRHYSKMDFLIDGMYNE